MKRKNPKNGKTRSETDSLYTSKTCSRNTLAALNLKYLKRGESNLVPFTAQCTLCCAFTRCRILRTWVCNEMYVSGGGEEALRRQPEYWMRCDTGCTQCTLVRVRPSVRRARRVAVAKEGTGRLPPSLPPPPALVFIQKHYRAGAKLRSLNKCCFFSNVKLFK